MWSLIAIVALAARAHAGGYCSSNTFSSNSSWMHFTKEPVPFEYGFEDKFKSIHCCVKGYRSIEWFKDGVAYPWSAGVSNLILYPEAANQTLYTRRAARADSGNYTCRLSNETHSETHTMLLGILEKPLDAPRIMFISKDQRVEEGSALRLFCEALIGRSYLADARSDLHWYKQWPNDTEGELLATHNETKTSREDVKDIIGSYMTIDRVSTPDYGVYVCVVHSNGIVSKNYVTVHYKNGDYSTDSELPVTGIPWRLIVIGACCAGVAIATVAALRQRCLYRVLLAARHAARSSAQAARVLEKEFDVLVCWTEVDGELVRGALIPTLSLKYKYRVHSTTLPTQPDTWYSEIIGSAHRCRSTVLVLSPAQYSPVQLLTALRQVGALPQPPIVVLLQDLPKLKREAKDSGETLVAILRRTKLVPWRHLHDRAFWDSLRLALPLPPPVQVKIPTGESKENYSRSGSMTALV